MELFQFYELNWLAVLVCVVFSQAFLTVWFVVIFGNAWALEYGSKDKRQHAKEIPGYTYAIQIICTILLIVGIALLQHSFAINTPISGLLFGVLLALCFAIASALPGYAFLKRWSAFFIATGSQALLIVIISTVLAVWS